MARSPLLPIPQRPANPWRVQRIFPDGRREFVTLAGEPWEGSAEQARRRAQVLAAEEPQHRFHAVRIEG